MTSSSVGPPPPRKTTNLVARFATCLATGMGICRVVPAPGTIGTALFGMPLAWAVGQLPSLPAQLLAILLIAAAGVPLTTLANRTLGSAKDHQAIVWDEIAAMPIVFLLVPFKNWSIGLAGFALFRLFDIVKPPPARQCERLPEGLGIMSDDLMAAVYAMLALALLNWLDQESGVNLLAAIGG